MQPDFFISRPECLYNRRMNLKIIFAVVSSLVGIVCFIPYLRDIFRGTTKPHTYTWLIWTILQTIGVLAMFNSGAGIGILSLSIGALFCGFIFLLSFKYGTSNIKTFDKICLISALCAIFIYLFLHNALLSVVVVTLTDFIGFLPTIRKAYEEPKTETASNYGLSSASSALALFALTNFNLTTSLYLITVVITNGICATIILVRRK